MIAMWCIFDKFILCHTPFLIILFFFYFRYKLYSNLQKLPCELLEFSLSTRHLFFLWFCFISVFRGSHPHSYRSPAASSAQPLLQPSLLLQQPSDRRWLSWLPVYLIPFRPFSAQSSYPSECSSVLQSVSGLLLFRC